MSRLHPKILAHRGASGHQPENTLEAFREASRLGADGVELDIHATADNVLVVRHDPEIPGLGAIPTLSLRAIRGAPVAEAASVPTLLEALEALAGMEVWIELKSLPTSADPALLSALAAAPESTRCAIHSFDHRLVARLGALQPQLRRGILSASYPLDPIGPMLAAGANALWQTWQLIDAGLVAAVHRVGAEVIAWTVNDTETARALAELGVDGLCGDFPEKLRTG